MDAGIKRHKCSLSDLAMACLRIGAMSFGGWSTTALLLEKHFVNNTKMLTAAQMKTSVTYAQILPGATQVIMVANVGQRLGGFNGALVATASYLLPAMGLMLLFAVTYFHFIHDASQAGSRIDGLVAALAGIILANAYKIGQKHVGSYALLWAVVASAAVAVFAFKLHPFLVIALCGFTGLAFSVRRGKLS